MPAVDSIYDDSAQDSAPVIKKGSTIARRTIILMTTFALFLMVGISIASALVFDRVKTDDGKDVAAEYAKSVALFIDGDRIPYYAATGNTDSYYDEVQSYLSTLITPSRLDNIYILVPRHFGLTFIWDLTKDKRIIRSPLGHVMMYPDKEHDYEAAHRNFSHNPHVEFMTSGENELSVEMINAIYPIYDSEGELAALSIAGITVDNLSHDLLRFMLYVALAIALLVAIFTAILYIHTKKHIIAPISRLNYGTREIVSAIGSDTDISYDIHTGDEIEDLAKSFMSMRLELNDYLKALAHATAEKERIDTELNVATSIQTSMLPKLTQGFACRTDFKICASMTPAKEVGGDFYDAFLVDDDHLAIVIADVSGKGVPAALFMVISKTLIKLRSQLSHSLSTSRVLKAVNQQLIENNDASMFVTCWLSLIDLQSGIGCASNAGHEHPVLKRAGEEFTLVEYQHSPPLGCLEEIEFEEHEFRLNPGDTFFVYTDGVAEAVNEKVQQYGTDRLVKALNAKDITEPEDILEAVHSDLKDFVGSAEQFDDITMLAFKYIGPDAESEDRL